ncbi:MAG: GNAT family N-acetyltransferase [Ruminococcaceae bacterium]|nr:GNAT family N-acetyltransferase [Oscillospiraceae bacterium]
MIIDAPRRTDIPMLRALWKQAFGDGDEFLDAFENTAFSTEHCRCVTVDGAIVAALYWFDCSCLGERIAYLYAIATSREHRGMGLCTSLMDDTHKHLKELGYKGSVLVPSSEALFDFYKKRGYEVCSHIKEFSCRPSKESVDVFRIEPDEYARLRRELLPRGGVVQENENLSFLQAQASFYKTDDALLAARIDGHKLICAELLGNAEVAPAVLKALGCTEGDFRTVGNQRAFAMYHSIENESFIVPAYFGLAFD